MQIPPSATTPETFEARCRATALRILALAVEQGPLFAPLVIAESAGGLSVTVWILRGGRVIELSACERDCLVVIGQSEDRLTTVRIFAALESHGFTHGESTVRKALARLVKLGFLDVRHCVPQGYRIAAPTTEIVSHLDRSGRSA